SVTEQVPIESIPNVHNEAYLRTKRDKMGHILHHDWVFDRDWRPEAPDSFCGPV
ncbi:MAG: hypothetical protein JSS97_09440, partial [Actinobacteria bacterium]|nr:hypothetical protein [Actinomycetota bacterium]